MTYSNLRACDADLYLKNFLFWHILVIERDTKPSQNTNHNKEKLTKCLSCTIYYILCQSLHKKRFFALKIFRVHVTKSSFLPVSSKIVVPTDLVTFTEQTLNRKLYFLCRECAPFVSKIYGSLHLLRYKSEPTGYWLSDIL